MLKNIFGPKLTPQQQLREWQRKLRQEQRNIDRQIRDIQREETSVKKEIKLAAKRGDMQSAKHLASELVRSRRAIQRMHEQKAQMNSITLCLGENLATAKVMGHLEKSTEVMKLINGLMKVPEMAASMQDMSKEMMKAGLISDMMGEALEDALDTEDIEEEMEEEVNKVLDELASETSAQLPSAVRQKQRQAEAAAQETDNEKVPELALGADDEAELARLKAKYK
eukprot:TRINITY_DN11728_c0_g1_i1.p2 TRINITY_DN11728_c0_g1~~TRINITY_DN11728_c0_g1_i1.p2  ORF type:complete len:225 (-),score=42.44 TRINITY_DN11728_c0_g1_i1:329-1003(-)